MNSDKEAFFERLQDELYKTSAWPTKYLFKFIVPTNKDKIKEIQSFFDNIGAIITTKTSSNGNFTSVSIEAILENPEDVIQKYKAVSHIEGIISL